MFSYLSHGIRLITSIALVTCTLQASVAAAADDDADSAPASKDRRSQVERRFNHEYREPTREFRDPMTDAWGGAWRGALIGLGTGLSIGLIQGAFGDDDPQVGRLTSGLTGAGFIAGAIFGGVRAYSINSDIDQRERDLRERYSSSWSPLFFRSDSRSYAGLSFSMPIGG